MDPWRRKPFYLLLLVLAHLGLLIPPLRFPAAVFLVGFLPGYLIVERLALWREPLFAAVGSLGLSFLTAPIMALPGCLLFQEVHEFIILISMDVFLLVLIGLPEGVKRGGYGETAQGPLLGLLLLGIASGVFVYLDLTGMGPYSEDWTYLFGVIKELSRRMPPRDPEASFLLLKYPWFSYFYYALLHRLGGVSAWKVLEFVPALFSFVLLGLVYMILFQITRKRGPGLWAIIFLTVGRETEWVIRGLLGLGWDPFFPFDLGWAEEQTFTVYAFLWGWYLLPNTLAPLTALFFLIRHEQEGNKSDFWVSWGACALSCFFHPAYYLGFMIGFSLWLLFQVAKRKFRFSWLLYYTAFLPYFLTFFLFLQPKTPTDTLYRFFDDGASILFAVRNYLGHNGIALPLAFTGLVCFREARRRLLPFALPFLMLSVLGVSKVNHLSHILFPGMLYLSLLAGIGLEWFKPLYRPFRWLISVIILGIIVPPFVFHLSYRMELGWKSALDTEQRAAGDFIRTHTEEDSTFLILPDSRYSATSVEGLGERKVVFGWFFHLNRYESADVLYEVLDEILRFFSSQGLEEKDRFFEKYKPDYVFLGPDEVRYLEKQGVPPRQFAETFQVVYRSPHILILKTDRERNK